MSIRSTAKAIILHEGSVLLNKCSDRTNGEYYSLPGGGQHPYETLHEALVRECLEETGYAVIPTRFAALCEEICMHDGFREKYPDYAHKMYHIFICALTSAEQAAPTEPDTMQISSEWIALDSLENFRVLPKVLGENIRAVIEGSAPLFLGSEHVDFNHG